MNKVEFNRETYATDERVFMTEAGPIFLPAVVGDRMELTPDSPEEIILRQDKNASCLNALEAIEVIQRSNGRWVVFADAKHDEDLASDFVGIGASLEQAVSQLLEEVDAVYPDDCVCINPAEDERFQ